MQKEDTNQSNHLQLYPVHLTLCSDVKAYFCDCRAIYAHNIDFDLDRMEKTLCGMKYRVGKLTAIIDIE